MVSAHHMRHARNAPVTEILSVDGVPPNTGLSLSYLKIRAYTIIRMVLVERWHSHRTL